VCEKLRELYVNLECVDMDFVLLSSSGITIHELLLVAAGWRTSLVELREAVGSPAALPEGGPAIYVEAARAASRQLQPLAVLIASLGQMQLLQQRIRHELASTSRSAPVAYLKYGALQCSMPGTIFLYLICSNSVSSRKFLGSDAWLLIPGWGPAGSVALSGTDYVHSRISLL
jgi:hypothetical protein